MEFVHILLPHSFQPNSINSTLERWDKTNVIQCENTPTLNYLSCVNYTTSPMTFSRIEFSRRHFMEEDCELIRVSSSIRLYLFEVSLWIYSIYSGVPFQFHSIYFVIFLHLFFFTVNKCIFFFRALFATDEASTNWLYFATLKQPRRSFVQFTLHLVWFLLLTGFCVE